MLTPDRKSATSGRWLLLAVLALAVPWLKAAGRPNVIIIYADDLGYGDVGAYGATKVRTPQIDKLAGEGRVFLDAHSGAAVCTPSRYALLTGSYPWRIGSYEPLYAQDNLLIKPGVLTMPEMFRQQGYATACIGKWHLGWGEGGEPDWNGELNPGPLEVGFDYYYGVPVESSQPPFVYVENRRVAGLDPGDPLIWKMRAPNPNTQKHPEKKTGPQRKSLGFSGGKAAHDLVVDEMVATHLSQQAVAWIEANRDGPFFLYYPTTSIQPPFTPHPRFKDTSDAGLYGDAVHELDWAVGEIMRTLEKHGLRDNTFIIFTSDNGAAINQGAQQAWDLGHRPNGELQGFKYGVWEGGHRVPFIAAWPGHIPAGTRSNALISSIDLMRTFANILDYDLPPQAAPDSVDITHELIGSSRGRDEFVLSPLRPSHLALRSGDWVYIPAQGSGGLGNGLPAFKKTGNRNSDITPVGIIRRDAPEAQLYNLRKDPGQQINIIHDHPDIAEKLAARLEELQQNERNAP